MWSASLIYTASCTPRWTHRRQDKPIVLKELRRSEERREAICSNQQMMHHVAVLSLRESSSPPCMPAETYHTDAGQTSWALASQTYFLPMPAPALCLSLASATLFLPLCRASLPRISDARCNVMAAPSGLSIGQQGFCFRRQGLPEREYTWLLGLIQGCRTLHPWGHWAALPARGGPPCQAGQQLISMRAGFGAQPGAHRARHRCPARWAGRGAGCPLAPPPV